MRRISGFTFIELLTVLVILAAMALVAVPYATHSNSYLLLEGECRNVRETFAYAIALAGDTHKRVRFTLDFVEDCYMLETADDRHAGEYTPVEDEHRAVCFLSPKVRVIDIQRFEPLQKARHCLVFDPVETWPEASLTLATDTAAMKVTVRGRVICVEDLSGSNRVD